MTALPVIVSYGGYNAAGRSSFDQAYRRMVLESLDEKQRARTLAGLAALMSAAGPDWERTVVEGTLVRAIEPWVFDPQGAPCNARLDLEWLAPGRFRLRRRQLPEELPPEWTVTDCGDGTVEVTVAGGKATLYLPDRRPFPVKAAAQLPRGFDPGAHYPSRAQPRGLKLAVTGASDAVNALGIPWELICARLRPDEIGVYATSCLGQLQEEGWGGVLRARWLGERPTSKQVPLALTSMPADFVNAYVLGNVGHTEAVAGACASFLYNLHAAVRDIQAGRRRVAVVGSAEAPITLENLEGFMAMSALATEESMRRVDGGADPDPRRYSRPFCENGGFVMGESAQYLVLMDDALAVELGATIHGAVPGVFVDADGIKRSISSPGPGNFLTFAKAMALARAILGEEGLRHRSWIMAHGSSTPQNRVTESLIFDRLARVFDIRDWPVCAVKAYVGHSMASASGDQLVAAIGAMRHGLIPGIKTGTAIAPDVHAERLTIPLADLAVDPDQLAACFINAKGFGGNNATGLLLSPSLAEAMLARRHRPQWTAYLRRREAVEEARAAYEAEADRGRLHVIYRFGEGALDDETLEISREALRVPGFGQAVPLDLPNPYPDMA
ncbi:MAG: beta-ketoacyl-[acyl-carrier-protein] synthase FabY [Porticoccaceae bacterium]|nr:MAG: beta-ketoacyl-[acyl-carrier-protein] synthase FabY [Porticoccaceae bacterium]